MGLWNVSKQAISMFILKILYYDLSYFRYVNLICMAMYICMASSALLHVVFTPCTCTMSAREAIKYLYLAFCMVKKRSYAMKFSIFVL